jgi:hypothetical protein
MYFSCKFGGEVRLGTSHIYTVKTFQLDGTIKHQVLYTNEKINHMFLFTAFGYFLLFRVPFLQDLTRWKLRRTNFRIREGRENSFWRLVAVLMHTPHAMCIPF